MNADAAKDCLNIATNAIKDRNWEKAEKFLTKSIKLHETEEAQKLLRNLDMIKANPPPQAQFRSKSKDAATKPSAPTPEPARKFTVE